MRKIVKIVWPFLVAIFLYCVTENIIAGEREKAFSEGYNAGYLAAIEVQSATFMPTLQTASRPASGTILQGCEYYESEITVTADSADDYVVALKDAYGITFICFYVRAGETITVGVPSNYLYVYFACGDDWYGYGEGLMFGPNTYYSKDDEALNFIDYTWEYTLYPVSDGNFSETPSNAEEFF